MFLGSDLWKLWSRDPWAKRNHLPTANRGCAASQLVMFKQGVSPHLAHASKSTIYLMLKQCKWISLFYFLSCAWCPSQFMSFLYKARVGSSCSTDKLLYGWQHKPPGARLVKKISSWFSLVILAGCTFAFFSKFKIFKYLLGFFLSY